MLLRKFERNTTKYEKKKSKPENKANVRAKGSRANSKHDTNMTFDFAQRTLAQFCSLAACP